MDRLQGPGTWVRLVIIRDPVGTLSLALEKIMSSEKGLPYSHIPSEKKRDLSHREDRERLPILVTKSIFTRGYIWDRMRDVRKCPILIVNSEIVKEVGTLVTEDSP